LSVPQNSFFFFFSKKKKIVFYYLTYEGEAKIEAIDDPMMKKAILDQVANYGQTPMQLFTTPHLKRNPRV